MRFVKLLLPAALIAASLAVGLPEAATAGRDSCLEFPDNPAGGEVVITLTLKGTVSASDEFWMGLQTSPGHCVVDPNTAVCAPPDSPSSSFFGVEPCVADHPYVLRSGTWPVDTVLDYHVWKDGLVAGLSGSVTVTPQQQTRRLTYDYNLGLPNTAVRSEGSVPHTVLIIGILVAVPAGLVALHRIVMRGIRRHPKSIPIVGRTEQGGVPLRSASRLRPTS